MQQASLLTHLRDIILLPLTVTVIVPYLCYNENQHLIPDTILIRITGIFIFIAGLSLLLYTIYLFGTIGKGTLAPWTEKQNLVIRGPYKYCRNPMITGVLFILTGESLFLHSTNILIWAGIFFLINTLYFIFVEEPGLYKKFGDEYKTYKENVPRWIPRLMPYTGNK